jgi:Ca2+/Na+ antiporter
MQIEYQNSKQDFIDYFKTVLKEKFKKSILFMLLMLAFLLYFLYDAKYNWYASLIIIAGILTFILAFSYFVPLWRFTNKISQSIKTKPNYAEPRILTLVDDGIKTEGKISGNSISRTWEDIITIKIVGNFIFISTRKQRNISFFPKDGFRQKMKFQNL